MIRLLALSLVAAATFLVGCYPGPACVSIEGAEVCRPGTECVATTNRVAALAYEDRGVIYLELVANSEIEADCAASTMIDIVAPDDDEIVSTSQIGDYDWSAVIYLIDSHFAEPYYRFYGWRVVEDAEPKYVFFRGSWELECENIRNERIRRFAESVVLTD